MDIRDIQNKHKNRATLFLYQSVYLVVFCSAGVFLWWRDFASAFGTALIFVLMLMPSILKERYRLYLPFSLELGILVFIFLTLFLGGIAQFYDRVPLWDKALHLQSGILFGALGYVLIYILNEHREINLHLSPGFVSFFAVTFAITIGVLWEVFEFVGDFFLVTTYWQGIGVTDTMLDLVADSVGACVVSIVGYIWMYRHKRLPFTPWPLQVLKQKIETAKKKGSETFTRWK